MPSPTTIIKRILDAEAGRQQPTRVIARFLKWQLWRRLLRKPMVFSTITGTKLRLIPGASDSLSGFWYHQIPDFEELAFSLHLIGSQDLFVDVGANQGGWSLLMAGKGANVIAFEPVPLTRDRFQANLRENSEDIRKRVSIYSEGLSDRTGLVRFTSDLDVGNHELSASEAEGTNGIEVKLLRGDDVLIEKNPVLIKIDVEGNELGVLRGSRKILAKPSLSAVIMETFRPSNFRQPDLIASESLLLEHGFSPFQYNPWKRQLLPLLHPSDGGQNTIYIRDAETVGEKLCKAAALIAFGKKI